MILDTCALLWLATGSAELSEATRALIEASPEITVSAISAHEIGQKYQIGKLRLPATPSKWFYTITAHHRLSVIDISAEVCLRATELPEIHKDPFDRMIIATAMKKHCAVVTKDSIFSRYGIKVIS
jgi:PIN domain nuclease of toxin-antitoxin system